MKSNLKVLAWIVLAAAVLLLAPAAGVAAEPVFSVLPTTPRQGEALFIRLELPGGEQDAEPAAPSVSWRSEKIPLSRQGRHWVGMAAVPQDTPAGGHTLIAVVRHDGQEQRLSRKIEVQPVRFAVQRLKMAKSTASLYNSPVGKKEDAAVRQALSAKGDGVLWSGEWILPAKGRTSTPFGVRRIRNGKPVGRHRGLDIAAPTGTPIVAPAAGRVVMAVRFQKYGNIVVLDHGLGLTSLYMHMDRLGVRKGQTVERGERLGTVGSTGVATGPHLHWAVYVHREPVEPLFFVRLARRGLPVDLAAE